MKKIFSLVFFAAVIICAVACTSGNVRTGELVFCSEEDTGAFFVSVDDGYSMGYVKGADTKVVFEDEAYNSRFGTEEEKWLFLSSPEYKFEVEVSRGTETECPAPEYDNLYGGMSHGWYFADTITIKSVKNIARTGEVTTSHINFDKDQDQYFDHLFELYCGNDEFYGYAVDEQTKFVYEFDTTPWGFDASEEEYVHVGYYVTVIADGTIMAPEGYEDADVIGWAKAEKIILTGLSESTYNIVDE